MAVRGGKLSCGPVDRSAGVLRIVIGALFLESSRVRPTLLDQHERLPCMGTAHGKYTCGVCGPAPGVYVLCVLGFPIGYTSIQIIMTLRYK
jgi:hypothetical protein